MAIYTQQPRTRPQQVLALARVYFERLGLQITDKEPDKIRLENRHGYVQVTALPKRRRTRLMVDSCGWEFWARHFLNHTDQRI